MAQIWILNELLKKLPACKQWCMEDYDARRAELALLVSALSSLGFFLVARGSTGILRRLARACFRSAIMLSLFVVPLFLGTAVYAGFTHSTRIHEDWAAELFAIAITGAIFSLVLAVPLKVLSWLFERSDSETPAAPDEETDFSRPRKP